MATAADTMTVEIAWQQEIEVLRIGLGFEAELEWVEERQPDLRAAYARAVAVYESAEASLAGRSVYVNGTLTSKASALAKIAWIDEQAARAELIEDARIEAVMVRLFAQETNFADEPHYQQVRLRLARSAFRDSYKARAIEILTAIDEAAMATAS